MIALRSKRWQRIGVTLAGFALGLQLMLLGLTVATAVPEPVDALAAHALCLAGGTNAPAKQTLPPAHHHLALCCPWHQPPGIEPASISPPIPTAVTYIVPAERGLAAFNPGPPHGPANARAPPALV